MKKQYIYLFSIIMALLANRGVLFAQEVQGVLEIKITTAAKQQMNSVLQTQSNGIIVTGLSTLDSLFQLYGITDMQPIDTIYESTTLDIAAGIYRGLLITKN